MSDQAAFEFLQKHVSYIEADQAKKMIAEDRSITARAFKAGVEWARTTYLEVRDLKLLLDCWQSMHAKVTADLAKLQGAEPKTVYMDGVDWQHEVGETRDGKHTIYDSPEQLKAAQTHWKGCGIVKLSVIEVEWVSPQNLIEG